MELLIRIKLNILFEMEKTEAFGCEESKIVHCAKLKHLSKGIAKPSFAALFVGLVGRCFAASRGDTEAVMLRGSGCSKMGMSSRKSNVPTGYFFEKTPVEASKTIVLNPATMQVRTRKDAPPLLRANVRQRRWIMCFRPGNISMDKKCPNCGMSNGKDTKVCWKCGAELPDAPAAAPTATAAPGAPKAPKNAPGAPKAPSAPAAPPVAR